MGKLRIITRTEAPGHRSWRDDLRDMERDPASLLDRLQLGPRPAETRGERLFPMRVPPAFARNIAPRSPDDPLLRQVLPTGDEDLAAPGFVRDAVGDQAAMAAPGVIHKYHGRVLLVATGACAIHCRYCFRRHFPYGQATAAGGNWREALDYIRDRPDIVEVILSGGDPLMLPTARLARLTEGLATIAHVRRLRIHSRIPVVLPSRIDAVLADWLHGLDLQKVIVLHVNHAHELGGCEPALATLREAGATLLNQSVLLAGVNDTAAALCELSESLFARGVLPYYLHLLDPVEGAAHYDVDENRAAELMDAVRARLSGFLVPRLVRERAGAPYKLPVL